MLDKYYYGSNGYEMYDKVKDEDYGLSYRVMVKRCDASKKEKNFPLLVIYSPISRAYGVHFDDDNSMVPMFLKNKMDVFLLDWGNDSINSFQNGWKMNDYAKKIENVVNSILKNEEFEKINLFSICAGTIVTTKFLLGKTNKANKILYNDAVMFPDRDMGAEKNGIMLKKFFNFIEPFFPEIDQMLMPMFMLTLTFIIPGAGMSMMYYSNMDIIEDSGFLHYLKIVAWGLDERFFPISFLRDAIKEFGELDDETVEKRLVAALKENPDIKIWNLIGNNDLIVKPSCSSFIHYGDDPEKGILANQQMVSGGHFMYARKCDDSTEKVKQEVADWLADKL